MSISNYASRISNAHACNCVGPQYGQPRCPCMMRNVRIKNGRYIEPERDLGPVSAADQNRIDAK